MTAEDQMLKWIRYDVEKGVYRVDVDRAPGSSVSAVLVRAVEEVTNSVPEELPPLFDRIDPDALNALFASSPNGSSRNQGRLEFPYAGFTVIVHADGRIVLSPTEPE